MFLVGEKNITVMPSTWKACRDKSCITSLKYPAHDKRVCRLAEQLRGWMIREEEVKQKKQTPKPHAPARRKSYVPVNTLKAATQGHYAKDLEDGAYRYCSVCPPPPPTRHSSQESSTTINKIFHISC